MVNHWLLSKTTDPAALATRVSSLAFFVVDGLFDAMVRFGRSGGTG